MFIVPDDFIFPMQMDVYYASESQDDFGKIQKKWIFDRTVEGYAETFGSGVSRSKGLTTAEILEYRDKLKGRTKENPLQMDDGTFRVLNGVIITNIRDTITQEQYFLEVDKKTKQTFPTQYEFHFVHPYVNPWNYIEYYQIVFNRVERQDLQIS